MAGATLSTIIPDSRSVFRSSKQVALASMVAMDTDDGDGYVRVSISSDDCCATKQSVETLSAENLTVHSVAETINCSHCSFTSRTTSEMTQHRWAVHPLLARRKQHLMKQSRKRQNSDSPQASSAMDDVTPGKKHHGLKDAPHETLRKPLTKDCCSHVRRCRSTDAADQEGSNTNQVLPKQRKSLSLGDLSSLRHRNDVTKSSQLAFVAESATAPQAVDSITSSVKTSSSTSPSLRVDVSPTKPTSLSDLVDASTPTSVPAYAPPDGGLHTLAKAALSGESAFPASFHSSSVLADKNSKVIEKLSPTFVPSQMLYAPWASNYNITGGALTNGVYMSGDKLSYGYVSTNNNGMERRETEVLPLNPFSFIPCIPSGLTSQGVATIFPISNSMIIHPAQLQVPSVASGCLPPHLFAGLPMTLQSSAGVPIHSSADVRVDTTAPSNSKLTTLSHVATSLLKDQSNLSRKRSCASMKSSPGPSLPSPSDKPVELVVSQSKKDTNLDSVKVTSSKSASRSILPEPVLRKVPSSAVPRDDVVAKADSKPAKRGSTVPFFSGSTASSSKPAPQGSYSAHQRSPVGAQAMDDDRVRSLEAALKNTDCCDPNERSNVLPFRCSDGKWRMVRTKRIGGAWLVQVPGSDGPSVFLPNTKEKKSGETLDDWLKAKLNSFPGNPVNTKAENCRANKEGRRTMQSAKECQAYNKLSTATINTAQNDAIRNLLLQKTAIA